jgi:hypothetical protein
MDGGVKSRNGASVSRWGQSRDPGQDVTFQPNNSPTWQVAEATLVFCGESCRDFRISPPRDKLPRVNASRFQSEASCMHVVKLERVAMQS